MSYSVTFNGKTYPMPKCTMEIEEMAEDIVAKEKEVVSGKAKKRELVQMMMDFAEHCVGTENAQKALEYTSIEDVDTKELEYFCYRIMDSYKGRYTKDKISELNKLAAGLNAAMNMPNLAAISALSAKK